MGNAKHLSLKLRLKDKKNCANFFFNLAVYICLWGRGLLLSGDRSRYGTNYLSEPLKSNYELASRKC